MGLGSNPCAIWGDPRHPPITYACDHEIPSLTGPASCLSRGWVCNPTWPDMVDQPHFKISAYHKNHVRRYNRLQWYVSVIVEDENEAISVSMESTAFHVMHCL